MTTMPQQPNVLLLITDQQRADTLEPGHPCQTPNLDRLAQRGVRFTHAYTPMSLCSPARASMMTGLYPSRHGMIDCTHAVEPYRASLKDDLPMWSQRLHEAGYRAAYYGKWHVERSNRLESFGFDDYILSHSPQYDSYRQDLALGAQRQLSLSHSLRHPAYRDHLLYGVIEEPVESTEAHFLYSRGIEFIRQQAATGRPWLCVLSTFEPHDPFVAPREFYDLYRPGDIPLPPSYDDELDDKPALQRRLRTVWRDLTRRQVQEATACYYATCSFIDAQVGRVIDALRETGQEENTLVVYTSDHGELLGAHGLYLKGAAAYEETYRVPLVVSGPGVERPDRVSDARVCLLDLAPTLTELTGSRQIEDVDGASIVPLLRADPPRKDSPWDEGYAEFHGTRLNYTQRIVWHGRHKYVFNGFDFDELYDLQADPHERRNLAPDDRYASLLEEMVTRMWRQVRRLGDHNLLNAHYPMYRFLPVGPLAGQEGSLEVRG